MDAGQFDQLTRSLSVRLTRRKTIVAALLGALGLRRAADAQVSQAQCGNKQCANNPGICNAGCVCCIYKNALGNVTNSRCRPPGTCAPGTTLCPADRPISHPVLGCIGSTAGNGSVDATDPIFPDDGCTWGGYNYDATVIQHGGGMLSLKVRGINSGGGTLFDPKMFVFEGANNPPGDACNNGYVAQNDDYCCDPNCDTTTRDPYLEISLPAGAYTVAVIDFENNPGSYTLDRDLFDSGCSV